MKKIISIVIMLSLLAATISGCNTEETTTAADATVQNSSKAETETEPETNTATTEPQRTYLDDLALNALDGTTVQLSSVAKKYTIIAFWATWCKYCVEEIPVLTELAEMDDIQIIMLNSGESSDTVKEFVKNKNIALDVFYDEDSTVATQYGISGFPTLIFITEELEVMSVVPGKIEKDKFLEIFDVIDKFRAERGDGAN